MKLMWKYVHPASYHRHELNSYIRDKGRKKVVRNEACILAPWDFDIFQKKVLSFCAKSATHFAVFAAFNPGELIDGGETKEGRCGLASFEAIA